ncbi:hypothetical protein CIB87_28045 [Priestia megaterium]|uniref:Uncharacterized protein n=1 Tax=Priestia megaterium TaxID=1404 RepID=A0AA86I654_PRIMG|nr:hypothetical protein [Priestia megaterium]AXI32643.1 hypothetical protein CIB87_28045 [Priestia megaterium]
MFDNVIDIIPIISAVVGLVVATSMSALTAISKSTQKTLENRINTYKDQLNNYPEDTKESSTNENTNISSSPVKDKIELALYEHEEIMGIHQKQALMHSRVQFYTGIIISVLGFVLFVYILFLSLDSTNNIALGIKLTSSLIFEGIAVLFLKESHKLRESSKEYHDNLRENLRQQEAIRIANTIQNEEIRSIIQAQLSLHMVGIKSETIDITKIIESNNQNK